MKEDFLHYLWKFQKLETIALTTTEGVPLQVIKQGTYNTQEAGPDFFNAQLIIGHQKWAGNIEVHLKSSDWYVHGHQNDSNYDNVILHVVWEHDVDVFRNTNETVATLELSSITSVEVLENYRQLLTTKPDQINCKNQLEQVSSFIWNNWLERLFFERLNLKVTELTMIYEAVNCHWEALCFIQIAKYFGGNINGTAFSEIMKSIPFTVIQKATSSFQLEALFFGQANLLSHTVEDYYYECLKKEYIYLKHKYQLPSLPSIQLQFFRLRPSNFPTIRLAQLAQLFANHKQLFTVITNETDLKRVKVIFKVTISKYWETHYSFGKTSKKSNKTISDSFIDLLLINAIFPLQFYYAKTINQPVENHLLKQMKAIKAEKNSTVSQFMNYGLEINNAHDSQAVLQLKKTYCDHNQCLSCAIGYEILKQ